MQDAKKDEAAPDSKISANRYGQRGTADDGEALAK